VLAPRITLVSDPTVPDAEKLSWLVLGHGLSSAGGNDIGALQGAASALLAQGAASGVSSQLATAFGLDDFSVGTSDDTLQERIVTLGKKISSRLYVSYQQGLESASSVLLLRYTLTRRVSLEAEAGTRSALSLFYNFAFD
jgi:translocation and assembly module TamB